MLHTSDVVATADGVVRLATHKLATPRAGRMHARVLDSSAWRPAAAAHRDRVLALLGGRTPEAIDLAHPVYNFLLKYYSFDRKVLLKYSPGAGPTLRGVGVTEPHLWMGRGYAPAPNGGAGCMDPSLCKPSVRRSARTTAGVLRRTAGRAPQLHCFGLHEWCMLYRPAGAPEPVRHQALPLRLSQGDVNAAVEAMPVACTHYDATRFFTAAALPLNTVAPAPSRATQAETEQPGCVHATMDLFRYALKLWPWVPAELLADALELAVAARALDVRASPYDLSAWDGRDGLDLSPVPIETREGRRQYQRLQASLAIRATPVRARLLRAYEAAIGVWDAADAGDIEGAHRGNGAAAGTSNNQRVAPDRGGVGW